MAIWFNDQYFNLWEIRTKDQNMSVCISSSSKNKQTGKYDTDFRAWANVSGAVKGILQKVSIPKPAKGVKPTRIKASGIIRADPYDKDTKTQRYWTTLTKCSFEDTSPDIGNDDDDGEDPF